MERIFWTEVETQKKIEMIENCLGYSVITYIKNSNFEPKNVLELLFKGEDMEDILKEIIVIKESRLRGQTYSGFVIRLILAWITEVEVVKILERQGWKVEIIGCDKKRDITNINRLEIFMPDLRIYKNGVEMYVEVHSVWSDRLIKNRTSEIKLRYNKLENLVKFKSILCVVSVPDFQVRFIDMRKKENLDYKFVKGGVFKKDGNILKIRFNTLPKTIGEILNKKTLDKFFE